MTAAACVEPPVPPGGSRRGAAGVCRALLSRGQVPLQDRQGRPVLTVDAAGGAARALGVRAISLLPRRAGAPG